METQYMRKWISSIMILCLATMAWGQDTSTYEKNTIAYKSLWGNLIPNQFTVQHAGSCGIMSFGFGWHYHHNHWETELLAGWVPKYDSNETKATLTLKQRYIPWRFEISRRWDIEPLTTGMFLNTIFGENFWRKEPSRYDNGYYGFMSKVRLNAFIGQRFRYKIPSKKRKFVQSISAYYELSTCDLYLVSSFTNKNVTLGDILSLAIGLRLEIL